MRRLGAALGLSVVVGLFAFTSSASGIFGLQQVTGTSPTNSSDKSVTATCPAGTKLTGGGADVTGGGGQVLLEGITPDSRLKHVTARALEDQDGTAANWSVSAHAMCFSPPTLVSAASPKNSSSPKSVTATCRGVRRVTGVIAAVAGAGGEVVISNLTPDSALTSATITALEDENGTAANWRLTGFAICALPPPGLERAVETSPADSDDKTVTASCPAGKQVLGTGGDITGGGGQVGMDEVAPNSGLTSVALTGREDENGTAATWSLTAYAMCALPPPNGLFLRTAASALDSSPSKSVTATCPHGTQMVGAGADLVEAFGEVLIRRLAPNGALTRVTVTGVEDENGYGIDWGVSAFAICAVSPRNLELVTATSPTDSFPKSVTASCPSGKVVLMLGVDISGGGGQVVLDDLAPGPADPSTFTPTNVTVSAFEDEDGTAAAWSATSFAICGISQTFSRGIPSPTDSSSPRSVSIDCSGVDPSGGVLVSGGASLTEAGGEVVIDGLTPSPLTSFTATASEDQTGLATNWTLTAYPICAF